MRHRRHRNKLSLKPAHARMFKRNLLTSLLLYEKVRTTKKRAEAIAPQVDTLITFAKKSTPHVAIRRLNQVVTDKNASRKVMEVFINRYANRSSGLTHMEPLGYRQGDGAELVNLMLIEGTDGTDVNTSAPSATSVPSKKTARSKSSK